MKNSPENRQERLTKKPPRRGLFDAFVEADLLLVRTPALPSIRAHGTVVNGRKMVIYDTQMFVEKVRGAVLSVEDSLPKIARKCVTYVFIYNSLTAPCLDSDNHATKAVTDEILLLYPAF